MQPEFSVVASVVDSGSLLDSLRSHQPDIALIGAHLQEGPLSGFASLPQLRAEFPALRWIMLLDRTDPELVVDAFRAGARGVFSRSDSDISLLGKCIRRVVEGQVWADSTQLHYVLEALSGGLSGREQPKERALSLLTAREETVVRLVAEGMGNREIAQHLNLSEHTVKNYLFRIFEKLGFSNRVELVLYAIARLNQPEAPPARPARTSTVLKAPPMSVLIGREWESVP
jgi:DNA-binding NarL/FixJ family response regulator